MSPHTPDSNRWALLLLSLGFFSVSKCHDSSKLWTWSFLCWCTTVCLHNRDLPPRPLLLIIWTQRVYLDSHGHISVCVFYSGESAALQSSAAALSEVLKAHRLMLCCAQCSPSFGDACNREGWTERGFYRPAKLKNEAGSAPGKAGNWSRSWRGQKPKVHRSNWLVDSLQNCLLILYVCTTKAQHKLK